jgi:hypothetical protein
MDKKILVIGGVAAGTRKRNAKIKAAKLLLQEKEEQQPKDEPL